MMRGIILNLSLLYILFLSILFLPLSYCSSSSSYYDKSEYSINLVSATATATATATEEDKSVTETINIVDSEGVSFICNLYSNLHNDSDEHDNSVNLNKEISLLLSKSITSNTDVNSISTSTLTSSSSSSYKGVFQIGCYNIPLDYWNYRICPFDQIVQYHINNPETNSKTEFDLGRYDSSLDSNNNNKITTAKYIQYYNSNDNQRHSTVYYVCSSTNINNYPSPLIKSSNTIIPNTKSNNYPSLNEHLLIHIYEPKPFNYEFIIQTPLACTHHNTKHNNDNSNNNHHNTEYEIQLSEVIKESLDYNISLGYNLLYESFHPALNNNDENCLFLNLGWWTYKFCFLKEIKQFHRENVPVNNPSGSTSNTVQSSKSVIVSEYTLGIYPNKALSKLSVISSLKFHYVSPNNYNENYFEQTYSGGSECDLLTPKTTRSTIIQYYCDPLINTPIMKSVQESSTCVYKIIIFSNILCKHPAFKPKTNKVKSITCTVNKY